MVLGVSSFPSFSFDLISPFSAGGSTTSVLQAILPGLKTAGIDLDARYLGNCKMAKTQLTGKSQMYLWSNDLECESTTVDSTNFVALLNWNPLYLCGKKDQLDLYRTGDVRLAVNAGEFYTNLGNAVKSSVNSNMRVINYKNTGAIKMALTTGEVDLSLSTNGAVMATEGLVKCYAVTSPTSINGLMPAKSIIGDVPGSVYSVAVWMAAHDIAPVELKNVQSAVQDQLRATEYQDLIVTKMKRQLPDATVDQQLQRVNKLIQLNK